MAPDLSGKLYEFLEFINVPQCTDAYQNILCKTGQRTASFAIADQNDILQLGK